MDNLLKWAKAKGIHAPNVQAGQANGMRGLIATKPIKKNGLLLSIPRKAALIIHDGDPSPFPHLVDEEEWAQLPQ